jgi:hypothetical protein
MAVCKMNDSFFRKVTIPEQVLFQEVGGEAVLLDLNSERYFGLDEVGTRIWELLAEYGELQPVYLAMLEEYEIDEAALRDDLIALVDTLAEAGLITLEPSKIDATAD